MLSFTVRCSQVMAEYHIRTTVWESDPMLGGPTEIMSRADVRAPLVAPSEDELSILLTVMTEWLNELRSGHPIG